MVSRQNVTGAVGSGGGVTNVHNHNRPPRRPEYNILKVVSTSIVLIVVSISLLNFQRLTSMIESTKAMRTVEEEEHSLRRQQPQVPVTAQSKTELLRFNNSSISNNIDHEVVEFQHYDGAVIVTKIHGPHQLPLLKQSLCLLHQAYNERVLYDIVVFVTIPLVGEQDEDGKEYSDKNSNANSSNKEIIDELQQIVSPAKLDVVVDNDGIVKEIYNLSPERRDSFLKRCRSSSSKPNVAPTTSGQLLRPEDITWDTECEEDGVKMTRLSYNWQAEFRSVKIWNHPTLKKYKYMMWIDSDAFCTKRWDRDPIAVAMKHNLAIMFANYPQGRAKIAQPRVQKVFGKFLCRSRKTTTGHLETVANNDCGSAQLWTIHGFMHVTNLEFYRQDIVQEWARTLIGDCFLCRQFDDQTMVTVPAALLAPKKSWDMYKNGIELEVAHNNLLDGKRKKKVGGFLNYWKSNAQTKFPSAVDKCVITEGM
mmetsp:Transcript_57173/g.139371  ORF Transcript_57173/g.139371 Transcript_57173/m.139371 type:complete len:478 (+) Transcript_57173:179-1612(+)